MGIIRFSISDIPESSDNFTASSMVKFPLFDYPDFTVSEKQERLVKNGVSAYCSGEEGMYRVFNNKGEFLSVSEIVTIDGQKCLKLVKSFYGESGK